METEVIKTVIINEKEKPELVAVHYRRAPQKDGSFRVIVEKVTKPDLFESEIATTPALVNSLESFILQNLKDAT